MPKTPEGMSHNENEQRNEHASLYFAESPSEQALEGLSQEEARKLVHEAMGHAIGNNMATGARIIETAFDKGVIKQEEMLTTLVSAVMRKAEMVEAAYLDSGSSRDRIQKSEVIIRELSYLWAFLGRTLQDLAGTSSPEQAFEAQKNGYEDLKKEKKGIFGW